MRVGALGCRNKLAFSKANTDMSKCCMSPQLRAEGRRRSREKGVAKALRYVGQVAPCHPCVTKAQLV